MTLRRHPSRARLQAWLERGDPARVSRHVAACDRCMAALEDLSGLDETLVADLAEALAPPEGIEDHTTLELERRLRNEDVLFTFLDLFSVGWLAARTVFENEEEQSDD